MFHSTRPNKDLQKEILKAVINREKIDQKEAEWQKFITRCIAVHLCPYCGYDLQHTSTEISDLFDCKQCGYKVFSS